jgi:hypothetical protein
MSTEADILYKWCSIAREMHVSERTVKRWCSEAKIYLPHWEGNPRGPVWIAKHCVPKLLERLMRSNVQPRVARAMRKASTQGGLSCSRSDFL